MSEPAGTGVKHTVKYRGENCYITRTDQSLSISMIAKNPDNTVDDNTLVGLDVISTLATLLIERGVKPCDISERLREDSRNVGDLADHLAIILVRE